MEPLISVVIPAYNAEQYIAECLDSVLDQSALNYEIVIIDDGSIDSTCSICQKYSAKHPDRVKYYFQKNKGTYAARLIGWKLSIGDYVLFLDSDDALFPGAIEAFSNAVSENAVDLVLFNMSLTLNEKTAAINYGAIASPADEANLAVEDLKMLYCRSTSINNLNTKLISTDLLNRLDLRPIEGLTYCEDALLVAHLLGEAKLVKVLDDPLMFHRYNTTSVSHVFDSHLIEKYERVQNLLRPVIEGWGDKYTELYRGLQCEAYLAEALKCSLKCDREFVSSYLSDIVNKTQLLRVYFACKKSYLKIWKKIFLYIIANRQYGLFYVLSRLLLWIQNTTGANFLNNYL